MAEQKTSIISNGMIWFGAGVSIAEIFTGTLLAPLGFTKGIIAILFGHIIGCALLYAAGLIGARTGKSAMETVKISFGSRGGLLFALLNIMQLVGWTAIMIISGARATGVIANPLLHTQGETLWCLVMGALIIIWILVGIQNLNKLNVIAMSTLFLLTIVLSAIMLGHGSAATITGLMSFGAAVELSAAMPLSWLPLISDYTRRAQSPNAAARVSVLVYFFTSCWMYIIGLSAAIFTGQTDIALIMLQAGLGVAGILIIILSTVTTTFLDAYSAGVSFVSINNRADAKWMGVLVCVIGTLLAVFTPIEQYENFLYLIGSVFAPMIAILITDFFILRKDHAQEIANTSNLILWLIGFIIYRLLMSIDTVLGSTLPVMVIISILCILVNGGNKYVHRNPDQR